MGPSAVARDCQIAPAIAVKVLNDKVCGLHENRGGDCGLKATVSTTQQDPDRVGKSSGNCHIEFAVSIKVTERCFDNLSAYRIADWILKRSVAMTQQHQYRPGEIERHEIWFAISIQIAS